MELQEMREFVEGLFLMQYLSKDNEDEVKQFNTFEEPLVSTNVPELITFKTITYNLIGKYLLSVTLSEVKDSIHVRFVASPTFSAFLEQFNMEDLKDEFDLSRASVGNNSKNMNIVGSRENCKEFLIWLHKEIDIYMEFVKSTIRAVQSTQGIWGMGLKSSLLRTQ